jgi:hypothetical protein
LQALDVEREERMSAPAAGKPLRGPNKSQKSKAQAAVDLPWARQLAQRSLLSLNLFLGAAVKVASYGPTAKKLRKHVAVPSEEDFAMSEEYMLALLEHDVRARLVCWPRSLPTLCS